MKKRQGLPTHIVFSILSLLLFSGGLSAKDEGCPEVPFYGHVGKTVNTPATEFRPIFVGGDMLFTRIPEGDDKEECEEIEFRKAPGPDYARESQDLSIPMKIREFSAFPSLTSDGKEIYFSATGGEETDESRDIFYSFLSKGVWSEPIPIAGVNTEDYESQPAVSPDGRYLVFVSDRDGGQGKTDLYITFREGKTRWSEAVSLGQFINSEGEDISPFIDENDRLYFSSNGHTEKNGFDIVRANIRRPAVEPEALPYPVNTEEDELSCGISADKLYVSSTRKNGCGGEDIFAYSICGPAVIEGEISALNELAPREGTIVLENINTGEKELIEIGEDGKFIADVIPTHSYLVQYSNACIKNHVAEKIVNVPCSDTSVVRINLDIKVKATPPEFDFGQYEVPFFITGYYMPSTGNNIENLKQKFNYNMIGGSETGYILYPKNISEKEINTVEYALRDAAEHLANLIDQITYGCRAYSVSRIAVRITGYADTRPIAKGSKYPGAAIDEYGIKIKKNAPMDNKTLSKLRAYFTAKQIEQYLTEIKGIPDTDAIVDWEIIGGGEDKRSVDAAGKRRVKIDVRVR